MKQPMYSCFPACCCPSLAKIAYRPTVTMEDKRRQRDTGRCFDLARGASPLQNFEQFPGANNEAWFAVFRIFPLEPDYVPLDLRPIKG